MSVVKKTFKAFVNTIFHPMKQVDREYNKDTKFWTKDITKKANIPEYKKYQKESFELDEASAIVTRQNPDGSYDDVGMNNRRVMRGSLNKIKTDAKSLFGKNHRLELFHGDRIDGEPHTTLHMGESVELEESSHKSAGSRSHYADWVKDKGHITTASSSVLGDYSKEHKLDNRTHNALVKSVFPHESDQRGLLKRIEESVELDEMAGPAVLGAAREHAKSEFLKGKSRADIAHSWKFHPANKTKGNIRFNDDNSVHSVTESTEGNNMSLTPVQKKIRSIIESFISREDESVELDEASKQYTNATPYGLKHSEFGGKEQRLKHIETWHKSPEAREKFAEKIRDKDGFYEIVGHHDPKNEAVELDEWDAAAMVAKATTDAKTKEANKSNRTITRFRPPGTKGTRVTQVRHGDMPDIKYDDEGNEIDTQTGEVKVKAGRGRPRGASGAQPLGGKGGSTGTKSQGIYGGHTFRDPS